DGAEAGFWAAVERGDAGAVAGALKVAADAPLSTVLPVLSSWRRSQRERAAGDRWRDRGGWQPGADPEPVPLAGRWLRVVPAGLARTGVGGDCARLLAGGGAEPVTVEVSTPVLDRRGLAVQLGEAVQAGEVAGVVSLLALDGGAGVLTGALVLVQAL